MFFAEKRDAILQQNKHYGACSEMKVIFAESLESAMMLYAEVRVQVFYAM